MTVTLTASQIEVITDILCEALDEAQGGYRYDQILDALNAINEGNYHEDLSNQDPGYQGQEARPDYQAEEVRQEMGM